MAGGQRTLHVTVLSALDGEKGPALLGQQPPDGRLYCEVEVALAPLTPETQRTRAVPANKGQPFWNETLTFTVQQASTISVKLLHSPSPAGESHEGAALLACTSGITCAEVFATGRQELNLRLVAAELTGCILLDVLLAMPTLTNDGHPHGAAQAQQPMEPSLYPSVKPSLYPSLGQDAPYYGHVQYPPEVDANSQVIPSNSSGHQAPDPSETNGDQGSAPPWMSSPGENGTRVQQESMLPPPVV